jgi:hypothetical protein
LPQPLFCKQLKEKYVDFGDQKTNPKQTQTNPISKMTKMNASSVLTRDYEQKMVISRPKNKAKTNPISAKAKNEHNFIYYKVLWEFVPLAAQKNEPKRTQSEDAVSFIFCPRLIFCQNGLG